MRFPGFKTFLEPFSDLQEFMKDLGCPWMVIGGIAASVLGKPRFTKDVDIVILIDDEEKNIEHVLNTAPHFGFQSRIKDAAEFARNKRILLLTHKASDTNLDISLGLLPFERDAIKRRTTHKAGNIVLYLPTPEDLIIFKAVAHRPQDMLDIREIIDIHSKLNKKYIRNMVREFARVLEMPEISTDLEILLTPKIRKSNLT
ncbi:MAG: nucleotidyl transferase AbiEii/AbiGii toxin family protein [Candidatus Omnitrophica bacterium]|nr:nucleotidyl transferase AbiEii/AbiGii toxin family protein [Candidatus Omnitrophota bacterium]